VTASSDAAILARIRSAASQYPTGSPASTRHGRNAGKSGLGLARGRARPGRDADDILTAIALR
jgi:hypothetical protein